MKVLITGGSGLLGRTIVPMLRERYDIVHFDCADPGDGLTWFQGDLRDRVAIEKASIGVDAIIHVAALHGIAWQRAGDDTGFEINVIGTKNVLEAAQKNQVKRVVFTSSIWATGHLPAPTLYLPIDEDLPREPQELYGLTKKLGEQMCKYYSSRWGISTICLRSGGILPVNAPFGSRPSLLYGAVDVRDVAQAHVLALEAPHELQYEVMIITADSSLCQIDSRKFFENPSLALETLLPGISKVLSEQNLSVPSQVEWYNIEKARRLLGYHPIHNFELLK